MSVKKSLNIKIIRGLHNLKNFQIKNSGPSVVTIGAFDGMHLGHQEVINSLKKYPGKKVVIMFEPVLPKEFFSKSPIPRLSRLRDKLIFLDQLGIDAVLAIKFNQRFSEISPDDFIKNILISGLNTRFLIIGDDFRFGFKRAGDFELLKSQTCFQTFSTLTFVKDNKRVASSWVRELVMAGDFEGVKNLLGRPYSLSGKVGHGDKKGRVLGFPTLNIFLKKPMAVSGVYLVKVVGIENKIFYGVANIGIRPTLTQGLKRLLEIYLFLGQEEPELNAYGLNISVEFIQKIRDEKKFESLEGLKTQIFQDVCRAKLLLNHNSAY